MSEWLLLAATVMQGGAAILAVRLILKSARRAAWVFIAVALVLMTLLRLVEYLNVLSGALVLPANMHVEAFALAIAVCTFSGTALYGPISRRLRGGDSEIVEHRAILQSLLDNSPAYIAIRDRSGYFKLVNQIYARVFGADVEDIVGKHISEVLPPELANEILEIERDVLSNGASKIHEHGPAIAKGRGQFVSVRFPIYDDDGEIVGFGGIGTNISELLKVREGLAREQERFAMATKAGRIGLWEWNPKTDHKYVSPNLERMIGCGDGQHIDTMEEWIRRLHPGQEEKIRARLETYVTAKETVISEYQMKTVDGRSMWVETRATPVFDEAGVIQSVIGVDTDITDRKEAEAALDERESLLDSIFENVPVGILIKDTNHVVERPNRTYLDWYGQSAVDMIGQQSQQVAGFQTGQDAAQMMAQETEVSRTGQNSKRIVERPFMDGKTHTVEVTKFPIYDRNGDITRVGSVSVDLTDQIDAQVALREANERLETASRAKSDFLAHMSHELRTPLNSIIGFSQMTHDEMLGPVGNSSYLEYAGLIQQSAEHLLEVINDILDLSKIEAGEIVVHDTSIDVAQLLAGLLDLMSRQVSDEGPHLNYAPPEVPMVLRADQRMVRQVLMNVLSNAFKFTPPEGEVRVTADMTEGGQIRFVVADDGCGMSPEDIPRVLEPFGQIRQSAALAHDGTGLGLSITQQLLRLHGAELDIDSELGAGVRVTITFPQERTV